MSLSPHIGPTYPDGLPLYWQHEQSGRLPAAVLNYRNAEVKGDPLLVTDQEFELVRAYIEYWINAPCWTRGLFEVVDDETVRKVGILKRQIKDAHSVFRLRYWIAKALEMGLDPL